jgi:hypothetical protein
MFVPFTLFYRVADLTVAEVILFLFRCHLLRCILGAMAPRSVAARRAAASLRKQVQEIP